MKLYAASLSAYKISNGQMQASHTARGIFANSQDEAVGIATRMTQENWPEYGWNHSVPAVTELITEVVLETLKEG
jgi:hypothetical protein